MTPYQQQMQRGKEALGGWQFEMALSCFRQALELADTPQETTEACYYLSQLAKEPKQALDYLHTALRLTPDHWGAHFQLAGKAYEAGNLIAALARLRLLSRLDPLDYSCWSEPMALIYTQLGKPRKARKLLRKGKSLWYKRQCAKNGLSH